MSDTAPASAAPVEEVAVAPTPISVEPRTAPPAEAAEIARQAEEAKLPPAKGKDEPVKGKTEEPKSQKPLSTREALRAAREKIEAESATPLKAEPKAAEPAKDAPKADAKADAKSEPAVARGEDGKFVSTKPAEPAKEAPAAKNTTIEKAAEPAKPSHTAEPPPSRYSAKAKEEWAALPEETRAETLRLEREYKAGFEKHRAAATRDADLNEFHEMATKGGTTVKEALGKYVGMEQLLRTDFEKGVEAIFANVGKSPREWAEKLLGQAPDVAASKADNRVLALEAELAELKKGLGQLHAERETTRTQSTTEAVTKFAADHPRFEELSEDIAFFLKTRHPGDLAKAYEAAERLNPLPVAATPEPKPTPAPAAEAAPVVTKPTLVPPAAQPRAGEKSIAGAPTAGSDPARKQPSSSIKEALRRARAAAG